MYRRVACLDDFFDDLPIPSLLKGEELSIFTYAKAHQKPSQCIQNADQVAWIPQNLRAFLTLAIHCIDVLVCRINSSQICLTDRISQSFIASIQILVRFEMMCRQESSQPKEPA